MEVRPTRGPSGRAAVHGAPLLMPAITKHCGCVSPLKPAKVPHLSLKCVMQTHYTAVRWCAESRVTGAQTEMVISCLQPAAKKRPLDTGPTWGKIAPLVSSHSEANPRQQSQRCQLKASVSCSCIFIVETLLLNKYAYDNSLAHIHIENADTRVFFPIITCETDDQSMVALVFFSFSIIFCVFSVYQTFRLNQIRSVRWPRPAPTCLKLGLMTTLIREWG